MSETPERNKGGRPKGSTNTKSKSERLLDRLMASRGGNLTRILDRVMVMAEEGDSWAAKAILDRVWVPAKNRAVRLNLTGDPVTAIDRVLAAVDTGDISADEAKALIDIVRARSEMVEARDIERRLAALEKGDAA